MLRSSELLSPRVLAVALKYHPAFSRPLLHGVSLPHYGSTAPALYAPKLTIYHMVIRAKLLYGLASLRLLDHRISRLN